MTEPAASSASTAATFAVVALTALMPNVNGDALTGAFAGATLFAVHASDIPIYKRLLYLLLSLIIGYFAAPEIMHWFGIKYDFVAAFLGAATIITLTTAVIDRFDSIIDIMLSMVRRS